MPQKLLVLISALLAVLALPGRAAAFDQTTAKQAIIVDYETGQVLYEKNADEPAPTSSMSKVMTMYMVFDALKDGRLGLADELPVSERAWRMGGSKMFVEVGKKVKVEDLIRGVIIQSGNDATVVLGEALGGSEDAFAAALTKKAHELGMTKSNFVNASGWPDPNHYSTARDLSILARHIIHDFPDYYPYFAEQEFTFNNIKQHNRNPLLYKNIGADGLKTGHSESGGYGLIGTGKLNGRRVIVVVNGLPDDKSRAEESTRLISWALNGFENVTLFTPGQAIEKIPVVMGENHEVTATVDRKLFVTVPKLNRGDLKVQAVYDAPVRAPVTKGQPLGSLIISLPGATPFEIPLIAAEDVRPLGFFMATLEKAMMFLDNRVISATPPAAEPPAPQ